MKKLLLLCFVVFSGSALLAQSFSLSDLNGPIAHDEVVQLIAPPDTEIMKAYIYVTNNSGEAKELLVKKEELSVLENTFNSFCFAGLCFPPFVFVAPDPLLLGAGQSTSGDDFYGEYSPENQVGTTAIRYTFFDSNNHNDSVSVILHYITSLNPQSFSLSDINGAIAHDEIVTLTAPPDTEIMKAYIYVTNNSGEAKELLVKKEELSVLENTFNSFCFAGLCFPPFVFVAPDPLLLGAGQSTSGDDFYGEYSPESQVGTTAIRYTFFDSNNHNDSVSVRVHYVTSTVGTRHLGHTGNVMISKPYPNPASSSVSFHLEIEAATSDARIIIRNIPGSVVADHPVNTKQGRLTIPVNHLREGVYFYTLTIGNINHQTGRLVIKR